MSVFKYHAFIYFLRPPPWRTEHDSFASLRPEFTDSPDGKRYFRRFQLLRVPKDDGPQSRGSFRGNFWQCTVRVNKNKNSVHIASENFLTVRNSKDETSGTQKTRRNARELQRYRGRVSQTVGSKNYNGTQCPILWGRNVTSLGGRTSTRSWVKILGGRNPLGQHILGL
jgi:hypothetical protein